MNILFLLRSSGSGGNLLILRTAFALTQLSLTYLRVRYVAFHARVLPCIQLHKVVVRTLSTWPIDVFEDKEKEGPFEVI